MCFKRLNEYFSYNIIAINGWIGLFLILFLAKIYFYEKKINAIGTVLDFYLIYVIIFLLCIFCIVFIIFIIEKTFGLRIENDFILKNKVINFLRIIGILLFITYCILFIILIV